MEPTAVSPDLLVLGFLAFLGLLASLTALVIELARRQGWIASWRHPLHERPPHR